LYRALEGALRKTTMAAADHPPIREALSRIRQPSADEEARRLAFVRERALHDEATLLKEARGCTRQAVQEALQIAQGVARRHNSKNDALTAAFAAETPARS
jgi:hypothetical protein